MKRIMRGCGIAAAFFLLIGKIIEEIGRFADDTNPW